MQLEGEREASKAGNQFSVQVEEERRRMWNTDPSTSCRELTISDLYTFKDEARETVKKRWVEQGIWNHKWNYYTIGRWKDEEPLGLESKSETETSPSSGFFGATRQVNRDSQRATPRSDGLRSGKLYGSVNVRALVYTTSVSTKYQWNVNESKLNPRVEKMLMPLISIHERTRMSRTPGPSEGFGRRGEVYYLGCRANMKSHLKRKPPLVLLLVK